MVQDINWYYSKNQRKVSVSIKKQSLLFKIEHWKVYKNKKRKMKDNILLKNITNVIFWILKDNQDSVLQIILINIYNDRIFMIMMIMQMDWSSFTISLYTNWSIMIKVF